MSTKTDKEIETILVEKSIKEALKNEHGLKLRSLMLPLDDINLKHMEVLAVVPSRNVIGQAMRFMQTDPVKGQSILVKNCLVTHKTEVLADDSLFFSCAGLLADLMPIREGKLGKV